MIQFFCLEMLWRTSRHQQKTWRWWIIALTFINLLSHRHSVYIRHCCAYLKKQLCECGWSIFFLEKVFYLFTLFKKMKRQALSLGNPIHISIFQNDLFLQNSHGNLSVVKVKQSHGPPTQVVFTCWLGFTHLFSTWWAPSIYSSTHL